MIQVKAINGPFKKNVISVFFESLLNGEETKLTFEADYELGYGIFGKAIDKRRTKKEIEMGIRRTANR